MNIRPQFIHNCQAKKSKITHEIIESSKQHTVILKGVNFLLIAGLLCKGMKSRLPPTMRVSDDDDGYYYSMFHHVSALCSKRFFANTWFARWRFLPICRLTILTMALTSYTVVLTTRPISEISFRIKMKRYCTNGMMSAPKWRGLILQFSLR